MPDLTDGVCRQTDPDLFIPDGPGSHTAKWAKQACMQCPVIKPCFDWALPQPELQGVWGGTTEVERRQARAARARKRAA